MPSLALSLLACAAGDRTWAIDQPVSAVDVSFGNGDLVVTGEERDDVVVRWSGGGLGFDALPEVGVVDGVLRVDGECHACGGSIEVQVPAGVAVAAALRNGDVAIDLVAPANISAHVKHGALAIEVPAGAYALSLGGVVGAITVDGVVDDDDAAVRIEASVGAGDILIHGD